MLRPSGAHGKDKYGVIHARSKMVATAGAKETAWVGFRPIEEQLVPEFIHLVVRITKAAHQCDDVGFDHDVGDPKGLRSWNIVTRQRPAGQLVTRIRPLRVSADP